MPHQPINTDQQCCKCIQLLRLFLNLPEMQFRDSPSRHQEQNKLIAYLDQFGKQISSRKNSHGLEEQLASLSKAYNHAQEKLLETERALMAEALLQEKQRAVIDIYKHILNQDMEDEGILGFIQDLEQDEEKRGIYEDLEDIKMTLSKRKRQNYRKQFEGDKTLKELKKEVTRLSGERDCISDQSSIMVSENDELRSKLETANLQVELGRDQFQVIKMENLRMSAAVQLYKGNLSVEKEENRQKTIQFSNYQAKQVENQDLRQQLQSISTFLTSKLNLHEENKQNSQGHETNRQSCPKIYLHQVEGKLIQLMKYKSQYKKLKEHYQHNQFLKQEVSLLKLFLSEEALQLFKEHEEQKLECIETELRNLSVFEKNKVLRLEECEREIWKYRLQLMKDDEENMMASTGRQRLGQSLQPYAETSKHAVRLIESLPPVSEGINPLLAPSSPHNLSEFLPCSE